jgi:hypothetical protein
MASAEEYASWIVANKDKVGTPEFETVAQAYQLARQQKPQAQEKPIDVTADMSNSEKFFAGTGKAIYDMGRGIGQIAGVVDRKDIDEANARDKALMDTGAGTAGNIFGNLIPAAATAAIPGANTIGGGALIGSVMGALQPVGENDSRVGNMVVGGGFGGALPAIGRVASTAKAAVVDPFTQSGLDRIAGGVLRRGASDADSAYASLLKNTGKTKGFAPTVGQASADSGLASMERAARAIDPQGFGSVAEQQRGALANAVRGIGGETADLSAARTEAVDTMYDMAKKSVITSDKELDSILQTPAGKAAVDAANQKFANIRKPFEINGEPAKSGLIVGPDGKPLMNFDEIPQQYKGEWLHEVKIALDKLTNIDPRSTAEVSQLSGVGDVKRAFNGWLEGNLPIYGAAKQTFAKMSKPINSNEVGNELGRKFIPATYRDMDNPLSLNYDSLARAVRDNGDTIAQNVTGFKGANLADTLGASKMQTLNNVLSDSELIKMGELLGKGGGSDTIQKAAMSHIMSASGVPNWLQSVGSVPGGWVKRAGDLLYGNADEAVRLKLAEALKDPRQAATLMKSAGIAPNKIAKALKALGQAAQAPMFALPAVVNAE